MNHLSIEQLTKRYGEKLLFENLDISINQGEKVALIARNGKGKSTIFRILTGEEDYDDGSFRFAPDIKVGFLKQEPEFDPQASVLETVLTDDNAMVRAIFAYEQCVESGDTDKLNRAITQMDATEAWDYERKVKVTLNELGLHDFQQRVGSMSGGEQKRLALARLWIREVDMLLLDEPTNHLDIGMIEWLENALIESKQTLLMITHDRYFLENICDKIIELDDNQTYVYPGNYSKYLETKSTRQAIEMATVDKAKKLMKTELEWIRRMPKARTTKSKSRISSFADIKELATKKVGDDTMSLFIQPDRLGGKIIELHHVHHGYDDRELISDFNYKFKRHERIGLIGKNGAGKSTLLNIMTGQIEPDRGKVIIGDTVNFGYYRQSDMQLDNSKRVIEAVREIGEYLPMKGGKKFTAAQLLELFLFDRKQQFQYVSTLSGGEKRRLYLLTVLMRNPNFLILDEPTNDLDLFTLNILEDFLLDININLIIVSHDRFFMDKLVNHLFVLDGTGQVENFPGNYSTYRSGKGIFFDIRRDEQETNAQVKQPETASDNKTQYENRKKVKKLESSIEKLEGEKSDLEQALIAASDDYQKMIELQMQIEKVTKKIDAKTEEWMELSEEI